MERFRKLRKTRNCPCVKGFRHSGLAQSNERCRAPKPGAIPTSLYPDIHFPTMIPRRGVKIKFFLSVVIYVVKTAFMPFSAIGESPANAGVTRLCDVSSCPAPDTTTALPNVARYQLRYTRIFGCHDYSTKIVRFKVFSYLWSFMWSKRVLGPVSQLMKIPQTPVFQVLPGFGCFGHG